MLTKCRGTVNKCFCWYSTFRDTLKNIFYMYTIFRDIVKKCFYTYATFRDKLKKSICIPPEFRYALKNNFYFSRNEDAELKKIIHANILHNGMMKKFIISSTQILFQYLFRHSTK